MSDCVKVCLAEQSMNKNMYKLIKIEGKERNTETKDKREGRIGMKAKNERGSHTGETKA